MIALCLLSACAGGVRTTTVRHSVDYAKILKENNLALLPSEVVVNMVNAGNGQERMYNYEYHMEEVISREVVAAFNAKGYRVTAVRKADIHTQKLSHELVDMRAEYGRVYKSLYMPYAMDEKLAFTVRRDIGTKAASLGEKTNSPVLVLVDYAGSVKTNGARAKDFAMDVLLGTRQSSNAEGAVLSIGLVEAATGAILWSNMGAESEDIYGSALDNLSSQDEVETKRVKQLVTRVLSPLPDKNMLGNEAVSVKK
jgi:hypothetical protein